MSSSMTDSVVGMDLRCSTSFWRADQRIVPKSIDAGLAVEPATCDIARSTGTRR